MEAIASSRGQHDRLEAITSRLAANKTHAKPNAQAKLNTPTHRGKYLIDKQNSTQVSAHV